MADQPGELGVGVAYRSGDIDFHPCDTADEAFALARALKATLFGATVWVGLREATPPDQEGRPA